MADQPARLEVPPGGAVVRMYCTGLGDCFLIALAGDDDDPRFLMIDCGVWRGTPDPKPRMQRVMGDIADVTGGHLHVLCVTHEHWDHLSGFAQAEEVFGKRIKQIDHVWMGWTENPKDDDATALRKQRKMAIDTLNAVLTRLDEQRAVLQGDAARRRQAERTMGVAGNLRSLLGFFGQDPALGAAALGAAPKTSDLLEAVRVRVESPDYLRPGRMVEFPGAGYARVHVLGPPTDVKLLKKSDPSAGSASEVYLTGLGMDPQRALLAAAARLDDAKPDKLDPEDLEALELSYPFDTCYGRKPGKTAGTASAVTKSRYDDRDEAFRRIDTDWLEAAGHLALALDSDTNNTSLVLAVELGAGGPVLLFPGDAQVGNWLSWDKAPIQGTTIDDLLARTVLYKVGHHGSHNATLRDRGLRRMTNPNLVAMIPVDQAEARKPKGGNPEGWEMPYGKLLRALIDQTAGRVMRADTGIIAPDPKKPPAGYSKKKWDAFARDAKVVKGDDGRPFYIQYTVRPGAGTHGTHTTDAGGADR